MKIRNFSAILLSAAFATPAIAATQYNGADYIQSATINTKQIQNILSSTNECDIEGRNFTTGTEIRTFSNSSDADECSTLTINNVITETTFINAGYTYESTTYEYDPGVTVLKETMEIGEAWGGTSSVTYGDNSGSRVDVLTLENIEDISVAAGDFSDCLKINWGIDYSYRTDLTTNVWICPNFGVVKYNYVGFENSWELQNISSAPLISGTPATEVTENLNYTFTPTASDLDGDTLTFSIENMPTWASFDAETGILSGTPTSGNAGVNTDITISVTDGTQTATLNPFELTVIEAETSDSGSSGGGSLPISILTILGLIAIRKRH